VRTPPDPAPARAFTRAPSRASCRASFRVSCRALRAHLGLLLFAALLLVTGPFGPALAAAEDVTARARSLIDRGRPAQAVPLLEDAAVATPGDAQVVSLLGIAYHRTGRHREAVIALTHAAALVPEDGELAGLIRYNLGAAHFALGDFDAAAEAFLAVPSRAPRAAAAAYLNAGLARYKAGRLPEARDLLAQAIDAEPDGPSADTARRMLDALAPAPAAQASGGRRARASTWLYVGREFDSNLFALNSAASTNLSDGRTTVGGEVEDRIPLSGRYDLTPHYDFYGYWYTNEHAYNYARHRAFLRLEDRNGALRPRLTWGYDFTLLNHDGFVSSHWLEGRLTVHRGRGSRVWVRVGVAAEEAPGHRFDYLSGTSWEAALSGYHRALADGWLYASLRLRYRDRGTAHEVLGTTDVRADYSYAAAEPLVRAHTRLPWRVDLTGTAAFEVRRYLNDDTWTDPAFHSKRRVDRDVTGVVTLSRPLVGALRATLSWRGQLRTSNIGNDPADYRNRDYERQIYGVFLEGDW